MPREGGSRRGKPKYIFCKIVYVLLQGDAMIINSYGQNVVFVKYF